MKKRFGVVLICIVLMSIPTSAQSSTGELLARINELRTSLGLSGYTTSSALTIAAQNHASWMVNTGKVSHTQEDGSGPRARAQRAGYSSNWVSENIYMGSNAGFGTAWNFWLNSPIHYAGMTSPNYNNIGIGMASGANGYSYVLVFGNSSGSLPQSASAGSNTQSGNNSASVSAPPSFVVGIDAIGNIMHEVQAGDTIGDIALIYGYTWDDLAYMLEINGMTEDDVPLLEIGSVFLVPPQDGTYTPTVAPATHTPTATATSTIPPKTATEANLATQMVAPATFVLPTETPTRAVIVRALQTATPSPTPSPNPQDTISQPADNPLQGILIMAVILQMGIIGIATIEFFRRSR